jgi:hypothetical protein
MGGNDNSVSLYRRGSPDAHDAMYFAFANGVPEAVSENGCMGFVGTFQVPVDRLNDVVRATQSYSGPQDPLLNQLRQILGASSVAAESPGV